MKLERAAAPERREGRARLSVRDSLVESLLSGLDYRVENLEEIRAFCKAICRERNRWDIARRGGGLLSGKLHRNDAERALRRELASLAEGAEDAHG